jgi:RNA polymerase sigma factor (sigma-70 family)
MTREAEILKYWGFAKFLTYKFYHGHQCRLYDTHTSFVEVAECAVITALDTFDASIGTSKNKWVAQNVVWKLSDYFRHMKRMQVYVSYNDDEEMEALLNKHQIYHCDTHEADLQEAELISKLESAIATLRPKYKKIITEYYLNGKTLQAIGDYYGNTCESVFQLRHKALRELKNILIKSGYDWKTVSQIFEAA